MYARKYITNFTPIYSLISCFFVILMTAYIHTLYIKMYGKTNTFEPSLDRCFTVKENHMSIMVSKILRYRNIDRQIYCYFLKRIISTHLISYYQILSCFIHENIMNTPFIKSNYYRKDIMCCSLF